VDRKTKQAVDVAVGDGASVVAGRLRAKDS